MYFGRSAQTFPVSRSYSSPEWLANNDGIMYRKSLPQSLWLHMCLWEGFVSPRDPKRSKVPPDFADCWKRDFFDGLFLYTHLLTKAFPSSPTKGPSRPPTYADHLRNRRCQSVGTGRRGYAHACLLDSFPYRQSLLPAGPPPPHPIINSYTSET